MGFSSKSEAVIPKTQFAIDPGFVVEYLNTFLREIPTRLENIEQAVTKNDGA
jgi:hypothetical protein